LLQPRLKDKKAYDVFNSRILTAGIKYINHGCQGDEKKFIYGFNNEEGILRTIGRLTWFE
jgi:hypothetical protein